MYKILSIFITIFTASSVFAADSAPATPSPLPLFIIFGIIFYFFMIRPQMRRQKEHAEMIVSLHRGDKVVIVSGIEGVISKVPEKSDTLEVEIAPDIKVTVLKSAVTEITSSRKEEKKSPVKKTDKKSKNKK